MMMMSKIAVGSAVIVIFAEEMQHDPHVNISLMKM